MAESLTPRTEVSAEEDIRAAVMRTQSDNPALQRLQSRVRANTSASEVITSYDRMHHRHSRS
jgi:hypothetical protein